MRTLGRLSIRIQRFELIAATILVVGFGAAALLVKSHLGGAGASPDCFAMWFESGPVGAGACAPGMEAFFRIDNAEAVPLMAAMSLVSLAAGLLLGVGLIAREIETGTAAPAWALAGSRRFWLVGRVTPITLALLALLALSAVTSELLLYARQPWVAPGLSFDNPGAHGVVVVFRGLAAFGVALAVGAVAGRILPAMVVATALILALWLGADVTRSVVLFDEALRTARVEPVNSSTFPGAKFFGSMSRAPDGRIMTDEEAFRSAPAGVDPAEWIAANFEAVYLAIPGSEYPRFAAVESVSFAVLAVVAMAATVVIVDRRRPI
jgi:hypothetical protein